MKLLLRYITLLGPRTVIAEVADTNTAWAIQSAHMAMGGESSLCEEMPRLSLATHLEKHRRRIKLVPADNKVMRLERPKS